MKRLITICSVIVLFSMGYARAGTWTTLDAPAAQGATWITGSSGSNLVGYYQNASGGITSFLYNGTTWTPLVTPWADVAVIGISGSNLVGTYNTGIDHGCFYNGSTWTTLDVPGAISTIINGISGSNLVGYYQNAPSGTNEHGFLYNTMTQVWTTIDKPGASSTSIFGIDGSNLVGEYYVAYSEEHGFLYNTATQTWTTIDRPGTGDTRITGISGNSLVGLNTSGYHGFLYDGTTWTTLDPPGSILTYIFGIGGDNIVGHYITFDGVYSHGHGFVYTIPEPATLTLLALGGLVLLRRRRRQYSALKPQLG
jgi:hypothetical protein